MVFHRSRSLAIRCAILAHSESPSERSGVLTHQNRTARRKASSWKLVSFLEEPIFKLAKSSAFSAGCFFMPKKTDRPTLAEPSLATWRALYEAADAFAALRLWECMGDAELIGVEDEHTGEPMLGSVLGVNREVFGISIHYGALGLRWVLEVATTDDPSPDMEALLSSTVLKVEFVRKSELNAAEKKRAAAIRFLPSGGKNAKWPIFESIQPGYIPWTIDEAEARLLLHALPRLTAVGAVVKPIFEKEDPLPADGFAFWPKDRALEVPLRLDEVVWRHIAMPPEPPPVIFSAEASAVAKLTSLPFKKGLILELDSFMCSNSIHDRARPWIVKAGLAVEKSSGFVLGVKLGDSPEDPLGAIAARAMMMAIEALSHRPEALHLAKPQLIAALTPFATQLGIRIVAARELPMLEEARQGMPPQFGF